MAAERPEEERARLLEQAVERGMREALRDPARKDLVKAAMREALAEYDRAERVAAMTDALRAVFKEVVFTFGKWGLATIGGAVVLTFLGLLLYFGAIKAGWTPPK